MDARERFEARRCGRSVSREMGAGEAVRREVEGEATAAAAVWGEFGCSGERS